MLKDTDFRARYQQELKRKDEEYHRASEALRIASIIRPPMKRTVGQMMESSKPDSFNERFKYALKHPVDFGVISNSEPRRGPREYPTGQKGSDIVCAGCGAAKDKENSKPDCKHCYCSDVATRDTFNDIRDRTKGSGAAAGGSVNVEAMRSLTEDPGKIPNMAFHTSIQDVPAAGWLVFLTETMEDEDIHVRRYIKKTTKVSVLNGSSSSSSTTPANKTVCLDLQEDGMCVLAKDKESAYVCMYPLTNADDLQVIPLPLITLVNVEEDETCAQWEEFIRNFTKYTRERCRIFTDLVDDMTAIRVPAQVRPYQTCLKAFKHEVIRCLVDGMDAGMAFRAQDNKKGWKAATSAATANADAAEEKKKAIPHPTSIAATLGQKAPIKKG